MSLFGNLKEKTKNVEAAKDSLGGGFGAKDYMRITPFPVN